MGGSSRCERDRPGQRQYISGTTTLPQSSISRPVSTKSSRPGSAVIHWNRGIPRVRIGLHIFVEVALPLTTDSRTQVDPSRPYDASFPFNGSTTERFENMARKRFHLGFERGRVASQWENVWLGSFQTRVVDLIQDCPPSFQTLTHTTGWKLRRYVNRYSSEPDFWRSSAVVDSPIDA